MTLHKFDVAVLGAGPAGAASALFLARAGFRVALLEQRAFAAAGPSWVNAVYAAAFDDVGLARPHGDEIDAADFDVTFFSADMQMRLDVPKPGYVNIRMRAIVDRLIRDAFAAGVTGFDEMRLQQLHFTGERLAATDFIRGNPAGQSGESCRIEAKLFVDCTGLAGALKQQIAAFNSLAANTQDRDICIAQQENCEVSDVDACRAFLTRYNILPGTLVSILGTAGGYSTMSVQVSRDLSEVGLLAGSMKDARFPSGPQMLKQFRGGHSWVGKRILGGGGSIPLNAPLGTLTAPGIALVGNAANQVFSTHGSGVMPALQAARMLSDAVAGASDPGAADVLWKYTAAFQRSMGAMLATYNIFRRFSETLSAAEIGKMFRYGLMNEAMMISGIRQQMPSPSLSDGLNALLAAVRDPAFAARMAKALAGMPLVYLHYRNFPEKCNEAEFLRWQRRAEELNATNLSPR